MTSPVRTADTAALAIEYGDRLVLRSVRDMHAAVARRAFAPVRSIGGALPEQVHDTVSGAVYGGISAGIRAAGGLTRAFARRGAGRPVEAGIRGRHVVSALNALVGPDLALARDPHAITMAARRDATDVVLDAESVRAAFPQARSEIVVMLHGLGENDDSWRFREGRSGSTYERRLQTDTTATPVLLRYNTGLHVSDNGAALSDLLGRLVEVWPVRVTRIHLVGHSMGGLVIRAATSAAVADRSSWPSLVSNIVCLGTPHLGAPLEKAVHLGSQALRMFPESAALGPLLDVRSHGIRDLRHGYISREEWEGQDLTKVWGLDRIAAAPLAHADYHFVAATVSASRHHPLGAAVGDLMVGFASAAGNRRGARVVDHAVVEHLAGAGHLALLNHPGIADLLVTWVNGAPAALVPANHTGENA